jgi:hypothetical protein
MLSFALKRVLIYYKIALFVNHAKPFRTAFIAGKPWSANTTSKVIANLP